MVDIILIWNFKVLYFSLFQQNANQIQQNLKMLKLMRNQNGKISKKWNNWINALFIIAFIN